MAEPLDSIQMHTLTEREICDRCYHDWADWHMTISHMTDDENHSHSYAVCNACVVEYFLMIESQKIIDRNTNRRNRERRN